jgi:5-methylcytosine-specific restriction endonuclease McrA
VEVTKRVLSKEHLAKLAAGRVARKSQSNPVVEPTLFSTLQQMVPVGISVEGLDIEDRQRIAEIGYWKWLDEAAAVAKERKAHKAAETKKTLQHSYVVEVPAEPADPAEQYVSFVHRLGITLDDLRQWRSAIGYDRLADLAIRSGAKSDVASRFSEKLRELLPKATDAGLTVAEAFRYGLQVVGNTRPPKQGNAIPTSINNATQRTASQVVYQDKTAKERQKRHRGRKRGFSPERMSTFHAVKARQRSGKKTCFVCGRVETSPHHIIPRSEGGLPLSDNIMWLCEPHHSEVEGPYAGVWERIKSCKDDYMVSAN